jgi:5'-3' exoribonuclease 1
MGIPGLFAGYYKKFKKEHELMISLDELQLLNIKYLFFDYNSLIHPCAQQILSANYDKYMLICESERTDIIENDIIENCINYTRLVMNTLNSRNFNLKVYIVIDGVAPRSKMNQQRERRYKSSFLKKIENSSEKSDLWDSNKITPGTNFMKKMRDQLYNFKNIENFDIEISDSDIPGEGEHKMMRIIEQLDINNEKICIYGLDADLIMLSLINKKSDSIILVRDNSFNNKLNENNKTMTFLNIINLKTYIYNDILNYFNTENIKPLNIDKEQIIHDYIILCFLLGNDFLDKIVNLSIKEYGLDIIIKAYIKAWKGKYIVSNNANKIALNLFFLKDIFYHLKNYEEYYFSQKRFNQLSDKNKCDIICHDISYEKMDILNEQFNSHVNSSELYFYNNKDVFLKRTKCTTNYNHKKNYYTYYGISQDNLEEVCYNYIEGIYWIHGYYNGHIHNNWTWYYKWDFTPFCSDLFEFLKKVCNSDIEKCILKSNNLNKSTIYSPLQQLCMVLPKASLKNILKDILEKDKFLILSRSLLNNKKLYPDNLIVDVIDKEYLWQSKLIFKNIDEKIMKYYLELIK